MTIQTPITGDYGTLTAPKVLTIQRVLQATPDRVWDYLTDSDLRARWLAAGAMDESVGAAFTLTWRNDELTDPSGSKPDGFGAEHSMESRVTEIDPPKLLAFTWGSTGGVRITLEPRGDRTLLTLVHSGLGDRSVMLNVAAGWHAHLDVLVSRVAGAWPQAFWDHWTSLKAQYEARLPRNA